MKLSTSNAWIFFCATSLKSTSNLISFLNARQVANKHQYLDEHTHTYERVCVRSCDNLDDVG